ncbi:hypothetical protein [Comamonas terrigena]|uniref:hypothetical protein n=1 Tax=Comamonas terrigena TaxID=32013 RepID=UPI000AF91AF7|nr:hypothetical protein [Comamonas terrigena]BBL25427.1 hypothetical protein CT3_28820 [Comamonas terrigena NBRC 13299]SUY70999.1 Uncharacterised protein [Comamonas terrigena]
MPSKNSANERLQREIDDVSAAVGALCELLAAAQQGQISADALHTLLQPLSRRLDLAAGTLADCAAVG